MKNFFLFFLICFSLSAFAQKTKTQKFVKLYMNGNYGSSSTEEILEDVFQITFKNQTNIEVGRFSPAIAFSKGHYYVEAEVSRLLFTGRDDIEVFEFIGQDIRETVGGEFKTNFDISLRGEVGVDLFPSNDFIRPVLSIGIQPYISAYQINPKTSQTPPTSGTIGGTDFQVIHHMQFFVKKKVFVDISANCSVLNIGKSFNRVKDPGLTFDEQVEENFYSKFFSKRYGLRLGIGYQL